MTDLIVAGTLLTMDPDRTIWSDGAVAVADGLIQQVGKKSDLLAEHPDARLLGGDSCIITPGFINAHQHLTGDRLIRSCIPDDVPSQEAIYDWVVPVHAAHTGDDDELSATLSLLEAVGNGITTTVEAGTVAHPDRVASAFERVGVRGCIGTWGWDTGDGPFTAPTTKVMEAQRKVVEAHPAGGLVEGWVTLVGHDLASDNLFTEAAALARDAGTGLTFHMSPSSDDGVAFAERSGKRPIMHLADLGVLGPRTLIAHAVHLTDDELTLLIETGTAVSYCPWAYLRLGQGVSSSGRHIEFLERGGRLALGCDTENAGDAIDALRVAALAAGLARDMSDDHMSFGAHAALELLTVGGAEAIGMGDRIGSVEVGKAADLVVHDLSGVGSTPNSIDPAMQLLWTGDGRSIRDVVVNGVPVVLDRRSTMVDHADLVAAAAESQRRLLEQAGLAPTPRWPVR
ncbi:MAG: amidohydrolase family protein [Actinobacteria bacterium]|jgi:5-methylthioadenosine/S-adenosylhomocysteine deaminase|nr:amidohydrolase family protein [Actinomycetota bacterium]